MRLLGNVLLWIGLLAFGGAMVFAWSTAAPRAMGGPPVTDTATERVAAVEGAFCDLLASGLSDRRFGTALSQSGELQHRTLGQLAAEWGRTGEPGARAQVELECRRLGLIP